MSTAEVYEKAGRLLGVLSEGLGCNRTDRQVEVMLTRSTGVGFAYVVRISGTATKPPEVARFEISDHQLSIGLSDIQEIGRAWVARVKAGKAYHPKGSK